MNYQNAQNNTYTEINQPVDIQMSQKFVMID